MTTKKLAFISQPMRGKSEEKIRETREKATAALESAGYTVVDSFFAGEWHSSESLTRHGVRNIPLFFLAKSLAAMSMCDTAYFCKDWDTAHGCRVEHEVAGVYGMTILYEGADE